MALKNDVGIDLGTANVLVYIKGKGIVLNEPSVVAVNEDTGAIIAVGAKAKEMLARTPGNIIAIRPLRDGVISDYDITERMLKYFINRSVGSSRFFKPRIMICVPSGVTEVEKRAVIEAATQAGGKAVFLIEEPIAASIGAGLDITGPDGRMVVDIGGGTSDVAVISLGTIVTSMSVKVAGDSMDEAIINYMRKEHKLFIGERTAEQMKIMIGTAFPRDTSVAFDCGGRDLVSGLPKHIDVTSEEMLEALDQPLTTICDTVAQVLEKTPPELAADISNTGIVITGGGALLNGIDRRIKKRTGGIDVLIADEPKSCVAIGTGRALESLDVMETDSVKNRKKQLI